MSLIFGILAMVVATLLTLVIVVQNSKGGGLSSAFGANNLTNMVGTRRATQDIEKFTWYLLAALMVISFMATISTSRGPIVQTEEFGSLLNGIPAAQAPAQAAPAGNANGPAPAQPE